MTVFVTGRENVAGGRKGGLVEKKGLLKIEPTPPPKSGERVSTPPPSSGNGKGKTRRGVQNSRGGLLLREKQDHH